MKVFMRISRAQFLPVILSPVVLGTAVAWQASGTVDVLFLGLALLGSGLLLLATNIINDVYDYVHGVDSVSDRMFPPEFPGWKVLPRGLVTLGTAKTWAYLSYLGGVIVGVYFLVVAGPTPFVLALLGIVASYFYVAPPAKADYRGLVLGELSIFAAFGPIPAMGAYFIQVQRLDLLPLLASLPLGLLTMCVLINHDLIFHDPYKATGKRSLTVVLGRSAAIRVSAVISSLVYVYAVLLVFLGVFPTSTLLALVALPALGSLLAVYGKKDLQIPDYGKATMRSFLHSVLFGALLAVGFFLGQ